MTIYFILYDFLLANKKKVNFIIFIIIIIHFKNVLYFYIINLKFIKKFTLKKNSL